MDTIISDLINALEDYNDAKIEHDLAKAKFSNCYEWVDHKYEYSLALARTEKQFGEALIKLIDARIAEKAPKNNPPGMFNFNQSQAE